MRLYNMKTIILSLAMAFICSAQTVSVSLQSVPLKVAKANLGSVVNGFTIVRVISCNSTDTEAVIDTARIALEFPEAGLIPKSLIINSNIRQEGRTTGLAINLLRYGGTSIGAAIASRSLQISLQASGLITAGGLLGLELLNAFKTSQSVYDFSAMHEGSIIVPSGGCSETLSFARGQKTLKTYQKEITLKSRVVSPSTGFFSPVTTTTSSITSIPSNLGGF